MFTPFACGREFPGVTTTFGFQSDAGLTAPDDWGFVAVRKDERHAQPDTNGTVICARIIDAAGNEPGAEFPLDTTSPAARNQPAIKALGGRTDVRVFASAAEAGNGAKHDLTLDFAFGSDKIDRSAFTAGGSVIGNTAFHGTGAAEVRFAAMSQGPQGDVDGDCSIDFSIRFSDSRHISHRFHLLTQRQSKTLI